MFIHIRSHLVYLLLYTIYSYTVYTLPRYKESYVPSPTCQHVICEIYVERVYYKETLSFQEYTRINKFVLAKLVIPNLHSRRLHHEVGVS